MSIPKGRVEGRYKSLGVPVIWDLNRILQFVRAPLLYLIWETVSRRLDAESFFSLVCYRIIFYDFAFFVSMRNLRICFMLLYYFLGLQKKKSILQSNKVRKGLIIKHIPSIQVRFMADNAIISGKSNALWKCKVWMLQNYGIKGFSKL